MSVDRFEQTVALQRKVATPNASAWVRANAGAGKTKVLTDRVIRLLLTNISPNKILAITFTKAAAAEMAERLFQRLGDWALMPDDDLRAALLALSPEFHNIDTDFLSQARTLFARALETPGGLKIQTIHAFCESVLRRFPLEANIAPGFTVLDEETGAALMLDIVGDIAINSVNDPELRDGFLALNQAYTDSQIISDVAALGRHWRAIDAHIKSLGGIDAFYTDLAAQMSVDTSMNDHELIDHFLNEIDPTLLESVYSALLSGSANDQKLSVQLAPCLSASGITLFEELKPVFLTTGETPRKSLATQKVKKDHGPLIEQFEELQAVYYDCYLACLAWRHFDYAKTLYDMTIKATAAYNQEKQKQGFLDFDDLIDQTASLFSPANRERTAWVLYKLDQGIEHLLVDEAQDTSPAQWELIKGPLFEFFREEYQGGPSRTAFVVGDEKQSIYSFQGADVERFSIEEEDISAMVKTVGYTFHNEGLALSFRTSPPVLTFVDKVFETPELQQQLSNSGETIIHYSNRSLDAGLVELWPLAPPPEREKLDPWDLPLDAISDDSPVQKLAIEIAATIQNWLREKRPLASQDRAVQAGDIMILCQSRGPIFHEIIRQLTNLNVPMAGADRLKLLEDTSIKDMLAAIRFTVQPEDDLSLAELLKSPLFNFTDDDLFALRKTDENSRRTLWGRLKHMADNDDKRALQIFEDLSQLRSIGRLNGPFAFVTHILESGSPSGWVRFRSRLGAASDEALRELLTEAIDFEASAPRSLQLFLERFESLKTDLKREAGTGDNVVRIMTVHGSKGLESPIVILADAAKSYRKAAGDIVPLAIDGFASDALFVKLGKKSLESAAIAKARQMEDQRRQNESRRQFYVAMTRARDELYICGHRPAGNQSKAADDTDPATATWYGLARNAMTALRQEGVAKVFGQKWDADIIGFSQDQQTAPKIQEEAISTDYIGEPPTWLLQAAPKETGPTRLSPSRLADQHENQLKKANIVEDAFSPLSPMVAEIDENINPLLRGTVLHLLLEKLPEIDHDQRKALAETIILQHLPDISENLKQHWIAEVEAVLNDPTFADVFGPNSRAEVSIMGCPKGAKEDTIFSGQIDRLVVTQEKVLIVDYKTNRPPPKEAANVAPAYLGQLAAYRALMQEIYPDHQIDCALLWTWTANLMPIPPNLLDHAFVQSIATAEA